MRHITYVLWQGRGWIKGEGYFKLTLTPSHVAMGLYRVPRAPFYSSELRLSR